MPKRADRSFLPSPRSVRRSKLSNFRASRRAVEVSLRHAKPSTLTSHDIARTLAQYIVTMPPKKAKAAAKARAAARTSTDSNSTAAPATVVTSRGKEYDTTAAATRARRATAQTSTTPVNAIAQSKFTRRSASLPSYSLLTRDYRDQGHSYTYKEARQTCSRH